MRLGVGSITGIVGSGGDSGMSRRSGVSRPGADEP